jgi:hypothetical protein
MSENDDSYLDLLEDELIEQKEEIEALEAELARLRAQLAAVPIEALRKQYLIGYKIDETSGGDWRKIKAWLASLEPQP